MANKVIDRNKFMEKVSTVYQSKDVQEHGKAMSDLYCWHKEQIRLAKIELLRDSRIIHHHDSIPYWHTDEGCVMCEHNKKIEEELNQLK